MPINMKRKVQTERISVKETLKKKVTSEVTTMVDDSDDNYISDDGEDLMTKAPTYESDSAASMSDANSGDEADSDIDDDMEDVITDDENVSATNQTTTKAPTNEEIQALQDTVELFKSNVFKLQIDEMLSEVRINYKQLDPLEKALRRIKTILDSALEHDGYTLEDATRRLDRDNVKIPFPEPKPGEGIQYTFAWQRPAAIHLVGSYAIKAVTTGRDGFNVDVAIEMPKDLFTEKDILNYRYFHKRAHYLAEMAAAFKRASTELAVHLSYTYIQNDPRRPILVLTGNGKGGDTDFSAMNCRIRIFPSIADTTFPSRKLAPGRNCVRPQSVGGSADELALATPRYNASLLADTLFKEHLAYLYAQTKSCPGFIDACTLARVWLHQRGFGQDGRVFNGFLWSMITAHLLRNGSGKSKLAPGFSSYQLFKGTMDFIATHDFIKNPIFMGQAPIDGEFTATEFSRHYDVAIVDPLNQLNLAAGLSMTELEQLQYEARIAMTCFSDPNKDTFAPLFLCQVNDPRVQYDYCIRVPLASVDHPDVAVNKMDRIIRGERVARHIGDLLRRGLTDRIRLVTCSYDVIKPWKINQEPAYIDRKQNALFVGIMVNPENVARQVDKGPSPEDKVAAEAFRHLWGDKAELRRFKDGSIVESVVWQNDDRSLIVRDMALWLIQRHLGVHITLGTMTAPSNKAVCFVGTQLTEMIRPLARALTALDIEKPTLIFQPVMLAFNQLSKELKALSDLPLDISTVLPASAALYYATLFPPQPRTFTRWSRLPETARYLEPIDVVLQFERSGSWPDDLVAVQHMKSAFYLKIREQLLSLKTGYRAVVAASNCEKEIASLGYIDIYTPTGFVFRCRIEHTPEVYMLRKLIDEKDTLSIQRDLYVEALNRYERLYTHFPSHALQLQALNQRYPAFSDTMRLTKRWFAAHMLLGVQVAEQTVELLCASVFADSAPWSIPGTGQTGFARVLRLLHTWSWKREPLIVDISNGDIDVSMTAEQREQIQTLFQEKSSHKEQSTGIVIATSKDLKGSWWQANDIDSVVVGRIRQLAKASYGCLSRALDGNLDELKRVFVTPITDYDVLLQLAPTSCPRYFERVHPTKANLATGHEETFKNLALSEADYNAEAIPVGFNPIECYLQDLQKHFGNLALFFHDCYGGTAIGVVWRRPMLTAKPLRVNTGYSTEPSQTNKVMPNIMAITAEMQRIGQGIVDSVEIRQIPTIAL
ncbi:Nrap protein [Syncephalis fuscata]|nr:Nrap protein [Syncephalis fuscata]